MRISTKRSCPVGHIYWIIFTILSFGQCVCESTQRYLSLLHACYCIYGFHALCHDNHFGSGRLRLPQPVCSRWIHKLHSDAVMILTSSRHQPFVFAAFIEPCVMGCVCAHVLWKLDKGVALFSGSDMHDPQVHINISLQTQQENIRRLFSQNTNGSQEGLRAVY